MKVTTLGPAKPPEPDRVAYQLTSLPTTVPATYIKTISGDNITVRY